MIAAVTNRRICKRPFLEQIRRIAEAGPDMLILREKDLSRKEYTELAADCQRICREYDVKLCVNSFVDTAKELGIREIQLPMDVFMKDLSKGYTTYVSVHSLHEAKEAESLGAKYLIFGNVFETSCKPGMPAKGLKEIRNISENVSIPVMGIGGIGCNNIASVLAAGASGVCIMSLFMTADDPLMLMTELREQIVRNERWKTERTYILSDR